MPDFLINKPPAKPLARLILAHGAGAPMDTPYMTTIAEGVAATNVVVARFEFSYMASRRVDGKKRGPGSPKKLLEEWRAAIKQAGNDLPLFIGGKSMGGRIATMIADEPGIAGIICLGYPFHPPGNPDKLRTAHLADLSVPTLILQGERDAFGNREEVPGYTLSNSIQVRWIDDGNHSFRPRKTSGATLEGNLHEAVATITTFIARHA